MRYKLWGSLSKSLETYLERYRANLTGDPPDRGPLTLTWPCPLPIILYSNDEEGAHPGNVAQRGVGERATLLTLQHRHKRTSASLRESAFVRAGPNLEATRSRFCTLPW